MYTPTTARHDWNAGQFSANERRINASLSNVASPAEHQDISGEQFRAGDDNHHQACGEHHTAHQSPQAYSRNVMGDQRGCFCPERGERARQKSKDNYFAYAEITLTALDFYGTHSNFFWRQIVHCPIEKPGICKSATHCFLWLTAVLRWILRTAPVCQCRDRSGSTQRPRFADNNRYSEDPRIAFERRPILFSQELRSNEIVGLELPQELCREWPCNQRPLITHQTPAVSYSNCTSTGIFLSLICSESCTPR